MTPERTAEFPQNLEVLLEHYALSFLSQGRKGWDEPHTRAVRVCARILAREDGLDPLVLGTVAWLHDIGYFALFTGSDSTKYDAVMDKKTQHMIIGAQLAKEFLERHEVKGYYTDAQRERVVHLISVHDKIEELKDSDEIAFMEADTLGAIDVTRVRPTFDKENAIKYIRKDLLGRRFPKFKSPVAKAIFRDNLSRFMYYLHITQEELNNLVP